jgi:hypothetical protein
MGIFEDWETDDIKRRRPSQPASGRDGSSRRKPPNTTKLKIGKAARPAASGPKREKAAQRTGKPLSG